MIIYRNIQPVKALSFDLDDTLYDNEPIIKKAVQGQLDYLHQAYPLTYATDHKYWWQHRSAILQEKPELDGQVTELRRQTIARGLAECGYDEQQVSSATEDVFQHFYQLRSDFLVSQKVRDLLAELAARVPVVAITNGNMDLDKIGIGKYFSYIYKADDYQAKPAVDMYQQAAADLQLACADILHVGDQWSTDVLGARRAGCQSAIFLNGAQRQRPSPLVLADINLESLDELLTLV